MKVELDDDDRAILNDLLECSRDHMFSSDECEHTPDYYRGRICGIVFTLLSLGFDVVEDHSRPFYFYVPSAHNEGEKNEKAQTGK